jgi:glutathione S-transferase
MGLPRDREERLTHAEAVLHGQAWNHVHLEIHRRRLFDGYVSNANHFDRTHGEGSYGRLHLAFSYAAWRLEHQGVIHPDDLEIVEAYLALPRWTGSAQDDGIDFAGPRSRLTAALKAPLDQKDTPRDPDWSELQAA